MLFNRSNLNCVSCLVAGIASTVTSAIAPAALGESIPPIDSTVQLHQQISTRAADLMPEALEHPTSPFAIGELAETDPTPPTPQAPGPVNEQPADALEQVAHEAESPIVTHVSIPIANRTAFGIGPFQRTANATSIQPVVPITLGKNYLVIRPSVPFVYAPTVIQPDGGTYGLGDIRMQAYFVPKPTKHWIWGIGPTFLFPTASAPNLGFGKWGIGPAIVGVWTSGRLTVGGRIENYWSVAGDEHRANVSQFSVQPLVTYTLGKGWYLVSAPLITAFWNLPEEKWLVPIGGGVGKIMKFGTFPFSLSVQAYWHVVRPGNAEGWALVIQAQSLFPQR